MSGIRNESFLVVLVSISHAALGNFLRRPWKFDALRLGNVLRSPPWNFVPPPRISSGFGSVSRVDLVSVLFQLSFLHGSSSERFRFQIVLAVSDGFCSGPWCFKTVSIRFRFLKHSVSDRFSEIGFGFISSSSVPTIS
jgi:hypothetical protein